MRLKPELTLDADSPLQALAVASNLARNVQDAPILMRRSPSRRGWHFWVQNYCYNRTLNLKLRVLLGDCLGRVKMDRIRLKLGHKTCTLFSIKGNRTAEGWRPLDMKDILEDFVCVGMD